MISVDDVKLWLRISDTTDDELISECVEATNVWVARRPVVVELDDPAAWPADVSLGAIMLAARLYRRRNTPSGIETYADAAVYVPRRDGDVDALLSLGYYAVPRVG